jgi:glyoxylase-like metal-dependent hydrolase (beta-lactamase superfamily II)
MRRPTLWLFAFACGLSAFALQPATAADVKITPLGSHDGEFCARDRAMIFEDPDGTRILYDPGQTVVGASDPRLGSKIDAVLLSHVHTDHLGNVHVKAVNAGTCAQPDISVVDTPSSNTEKIVAATKAKFLVGGEMNSFFSKRIAAAGGQASQVMVLRFGGSQKTGGVTIWSVPAAHTNGLDPAFLTGALSKELADNGLTAYIGPPGG